ncbi:unnamed protein product, partial [Rotaria socialis]
TTMLPGAKRRPPIDAFKRSRSFTNVEHTETQLGMDYIEEDEDNLIWKPFGPKKSVSQISFTLYDNEQSNEEEQPSSTIVVVDESPVTTINQSVSVTGIQQPKLHQPTNDDSSDEDFDVAWERRAKQKARKDASSVPHLLPPPITIFECQVKRTVRFPPSVHDPIEVIELDLDETTADEFSQAIDRNNNNANKRKIDIVSSIINIEEDETTMPATQQTQTDTSQAINQSQITTVSTARSLSQQRNIEEDDSQIIDDSD